MALAESVEQGEFQVDEQKERVMIKKVITGLMAMVFLCLSGCAGIAFKNAQQRNDIGSYEEFIARYPNSKEAAQAKSKLDDLYFEKARSANTLDSYQEYVNRYPNGKNIKEAKAKVDDLSFERAKIAGTNAAFQDYLKKFPAGKHRARAQEGIAYHKAVAGNTHKEFDAFLSRYSKSEYAPEVRRLKGLLPPPEPPPSTTAVSTGLGPMHFLSRLDKSFKTAGYNVKLDFKDFDGNGKDDLLVTLNSCKSLAEIKSYISSMKGDPFFERKPIDADFPVLTLMGTCSLGDPQSFLTAVSIIAVREFDLEKVSCDKVFAQHADQTYRAARAADKTCFNDIVSQNKRGILKPNYSQCHNWKEATIAPKEKTKAK
jgi:hypothetical protein